MLSSFWSSGAPDDLVGVIRRVRNRWRVRIALRGLAIVLAAGLAAFLVSSYGLEFFRFSAGSVIAFRALTWLTLAGLGFRYLFRPLARSVSDERVALYLEEHEPTLDATVLSALEETKRGARTGSPDYSPALVDRLVSSAVERCQDLDLGSAVEREKIRRSSSYLALVSAAALLTFFLAPSYLQHGAAALMVPAGSLDDASPYSIVVQPGDVTIARGADLTATAELLGFETNDVNLFMRSSPDAPWEPVPMIPQGALDGEPPQLGAFETVLFDIREETTYYIDASGVRSETFTVDVIDLPYVDHLELEFHFPAYTGLEPRLVQDGGDIAVLRGTEVHVRVFPTMSTPAGRLVFDETSDAALSRRDDGVLTATFPIEEDGFYQVELEGPSGERVEASPRYTIDVLTDQAPSVMFVKPGRDTTANAIEEVFLEARADDDFGVRSLSLTYSVNGGPEETVELFDSEEGGLREISAGHTLFLEEFELEPGDFISYYGSAGDNQGDAARVVKSDLYFVQIRAFRRDFRAAQSQGGGGGGGGGDARALSEAQRQVISATFNVIRDRDTLDDEEFRENLVFLTLAQGRLREQVETLVRRMNSRVMPADPAFRSILAVLPRAAEEMRAAESALQEQDVDAALPAEQRALQQLQRAEEAYDEVRVQQGGGGGGGGGGQNAAEDLADLFELELDKLQNQYETVQRGEQQAADNEVDALMERLRELARRQEQEAERQRRRARGGQTARAGGGASQRVLAEEAEEAARRLERLAREQQSPQMMQAARRLQEAADAMRQAAANAGNEGFAEAAVALDRLREVQRQLQGQQSERLARDIEDFRRRAEELSAEEAEVGEQVSGLGDVADEERVDRIARLTERKNEMESQVADLERDIDSTSAEFRREERGASTELQEAANGIRESKLKEKIRYSRGLIRARSPAYAKQFEAEIGNDIRDLEQRLAEAGEAVGSAGGTGIEQALDQTRDLMRGLESLEQRIRQGQARADRESGEPGQEGQPGQNQEGQEGQPGQSGQPGQAGQDGQGQNAQSGGQAGGAAADGAGGNRFGSPFGWGGPGDARSGDWAFDPRDVRQWQREFRERGADAQELQRLLRAENFGEVGDLAEIIQAMRNLDDPRVYESAEAIASMQSFVIEELKRFEYRLRREVDGDREDLFLASSDEVPDGFRDLIEEYFRALAEE
jgi:hypothetical protein